MKVFEIIQDADWNNEDVPSDQKRNILNRQLMAVTHQFEIAQSTLSTIMNQTPKGRIEIGGLYAPDIVASGKEDWKAFLLRTKLNPNNLGIGEQTIWIRVSDIALRNKLKPLIDKVNSAGYRWDRIKDRRTLERK